MDKAYLRFQLEKHKTALKDLLESKKPVKVLNEADESFLTLLLKLVHLVAIGELPITEDHIAEFNKSLRRKKVVRFSERSYLKEILKSTRAEKLQVLKQFAKIYPILLHNLFH